MMATMFSVPQTTRQPCWKIAAFWVVQFLWHPMIEAVLPKVIAAGIPFFAPYSGAMSIRSRHARNLIHIRASYADEADQLVQHLATVGIRRIAIVHQGNSFGKEFLTAAQQALARHKLEAVVTVTVENSGADAAAAASKVAGADPEAALLGLAGKPRPSLCVRSARNARACSFMPCRSWARQRPSRPWVKTPPA